MPVVVHGDAGVRVHVDQLVVDLARRASSRAAFPSPWKVCLRATGSAPRSWVSTARRHGIPASSAEASADAATPVMLSGPVTVLR